MQPSGLDLVFPMEDGRPMRWDHLLRSRFYLALARARLHRVTFHSLRHSCASAMIAAGAPVTEVQHQLGHSNPSITLSIYSHWFKNGAAGGTIALLVKAVQLLSCDVNEGLRSILSRSTCGQDHHVAWHSVPKFSRHTCTFCSNNSFAAKSVLTQFWCWM